MKSSWSVGKREMKDEDEAIEDEMEIEMKTEEMKLKKWERERKKGQRGLVSEKICGPPCGRQSCVSYRGKRGKQVKLLGVFLDLGVRWENRTERERSDWSWWGCIRFPQNRIGRSWIRGEEESLASASTDPI